MQDMRDPADRPVPEPTLVLIVDDEAPIVDALEFLVEELGYTSLSAQNGRDALEHIRHRWPTLVLTDFMMPFVSGVQLITEIRTRAAAWGLAQPIFIIMTAARSTSVVEINADVIVLKSFEISDIEEILRRFLDIVPTE